MENNNTRCIRSKFFEFMGVIVAILAIVVGVGVAIRGDAMIAFTRCAPTNVPCILG